MTFSVSIRENGALKTKVFRAENFQLALRIMRALGATTLVVLQ